MNTAARLAAAGHGGQTLPSGVTAGLLGRDDLRDLGAYRLDGVVAEQPIFQLGEGDRARAFQILCSHIDELLATDNMTGVEAVCVEFINMMPTVERLPDAARMLGYLGTTGDFGALASRTIIADAAGKVATDTENTMFSR